MPALEAVHPRSSPPPSSEPLLLDEQSCCLCGVDDAEPVGIGEDFEYRVSPDSYLAMRCRRCGLVYLGLRPSLGSLDRIYPPHYHAFQFSAEHFGLAYRVRRRLEARRLLRCCKGLPANARILDVGCGDGFHLRLLREFGPKTWTVQGVDASDKAVEAAKRAGLHVTLGTVQSARLPREAFDLVLLIATIEHVDDPAAVLRAAHKLLKPGGRVVIVTDNTGTVDFRLFGGRHWGGYHFPRHWNLFNKATLAKLASTADLEVACMETIVSPVNWVYSIRNALQDFGAPRWLCEQFSLKTPLTLGAFTLVDSLFQLFGRGALLRATFRRTSS